MPLDAIKRKFRSFGFKWHCPTEPMAVLLTIYYDSSSAPITLLVTGGLAATRQRGVGRVGPIFGPIFRFADTATQAVPLGAE